jgi:hypothetical protein
MSRLAILLALAGVARADVSVGVKAAGVNRCLEWPMRYFQLPDSEVARAPGEHSLRRVDQLILHATMVDSVSPDPIWRDALKELRGLPPPARELDVVLYETGRIELELRHAEPAATYFDVLVARFPKSPFATPALILVGDWHQRAGDPLLAKQYWLRARSLDSHDICALELNKRLAQK